MPTGYSLIAWFPLSLKIHSNYGLVCTWFIVLFGLSQRIWLSSGQSIKPQSAGQGGFTEFELGCQNQNTMFKPPQLKLDWLCRLAKALTTFRKPFQRFLWVLGISLKSSELSLRKPEHSLGFLCDSWITISLSYKYEALPLQNIITLPTHNSLNPRLNLSH